MLPEHNNKTQQLCKAATSPSGAPFINQSSFLYDIGRHVQERERELPMASRKLKFIRIVE